MTALVTAVLSVGTTYLALITKTRSDLEAHYDKDLRELRLTAYSKLWALSEPLARYSPAKALSPRDARSLSESLRAWYFSNGMVLSAAARDAYFTLQIKLTAVPVPAASGRTEPLAQAVIKDLQLASSAMHAALSNDVGSRRPPMIGYDRREGPPKTLAVEELNKVPKVAAEILEQGDFAASGRPGPADEADAPVAVRSTS